MEEGVTAVEKATINEMLKKIELKESFLETLSERVCNYFEVPEDDTETFYKVYDTLSNSLLGKEGKGDNND